jgi:opacity protein-like surface antigen
MRKAAILAGLVICICLNATAQRNQLALDVGVKITPQVGSNGSFNGVTTVDKSMAFEGNYARELTSFPGVSVQLEFPFIYAFTSNVKSLNLFTASGYKSMFLTPSLKLQIGPKRKLSPWISAGAGMAHFSDSKTAINGGAISANATTKGAFQVGGGVDFRVRKITFRMEVRDLYTGPPNLVVSGIKVHNNILAAGGVVFNF